MTACLIGLGSNVGERVRQLSAAIDELRRHPSIRVSRVSSFYESAPVGGPTGQSRYFNAAVLLETSLSAEELLAALLEIEKKLGRERNQRWGPRTIDLDLLLYGEEIVDGGELNIPHPRMHERRFVLAPSAEIAPEWKHPTRGLGVAEMLADLGPDTAREVGMRVVFLPHAVQAAVLQMRRAGRRIGLVPTMGALHAGHLSLVEGARRQCEIVVATIFVNPTQFGPKEDFAKYPRTLDADLTALSAAGCDLVFVPEPWAMYPSGFSTYVEPPAVAERLEGECRPGHFRGVATIVLKLFHLIPGDAAYFGQKDYQQLQVIRSLVRDLDLPIEIVSCPTVREPDGLAMSSRNRYLSPAEREQALAISRSLKRAEELVCGGERRAAVVVGAMRLILEKAGIQRIDYVSVADPETLVEKDVLDGPAVALVAAHVGTTRLIDNKLLQEAG